MPLPPGNPHRRRSVEHSSLIQAIGFSLWVWQKLSCDFHHVLGQIQDALTEISNIDLVEQFDWLSGRQHC